jgi:hypothetical protein
MLTIGMYEDILCQGEAWENQVHINFGRRKKLVPFDRIGYVTMTIEQAEQLREQLRIAIYRATIFDPEAESETETEIETESETEVETETKS